MSKRREDQPSLFLATETGEQADEREPSRYIVEFIAGMLVQHTAQRKLTSTERIDVEQLARQALRDVSARLG